MHFKPLHFRTVLVLALLITLVCTGCAPVRTASPAEGGVSVHFLDVGQADCILITSGDEAMLVDAGNNDDAADITAYLDELGIQTLAYIIGTHPHEDHIGSLDTVIERYAIGTVIMPKVQSNTRTFEDVLDAVAAKNLKITTPLVGTQYTLGSCTFTILAPNADYGDNLNNWSVGIRLVCGDTAFVLCGDAETPAEADILSTDLELRADVLKLGHHGSSTSTSDAFLAAVSPSAVVISCETGNTYGHPHQETLNKISGLDVYRTDTQGTVVAVSDGNTITWSTAPANSGRQPAETPAYILNTSSMKFHDPGCSGAAQISEANRAESSQTREELIQAGYSPCGRCNP